MSAVLKKFKKTVGNEFSFIGDDENEDNPYIFTEFVDTGCYILNALLSDGDIYKGIPIGKRIGIAGPSGTAKSFLTAHIMKKWLEGNDNRYIIAFESEGATMVTMLRNLNCDNSRVLILPVSTVEEFREQSIRVVEEQLKDKSKEKPEILMILDSLGMLGTAKETEDAISGKSTTDMTRAKIIKSIFRIITLKLSLAKIPLIVVNHSIQTLEMFSKTVATGGSGYQYAIDVGFILSKAKEKEGSNHVGALITLNVDKHRLIPEGQKGKVLLHFAKGLYKYSYLFEIAVELGLFKKDGHGYVLPNGKKMRQKEILKNPTECYTIDILDTLQKSIKEYYGFGVDKLQNTDFDEIEEEKVEEESE